MAMMICGRCGRSGIFWKDLGGMNEHTYCPHCGGVHCQRPEEKELDEGEAGGGE